jgi:gamma-glutamyltranspeptidase/glutathione hydrolase
MLNIMEHFPMSEYGHNSIDGLHVMIEVKKLAYADTYKYVGDPRFTPIPVSELISKSLAARPGQRAVCCLLPEQHFSSADLASGAFPEEFDRISVWT